MLKHNITAASESLRAFLSTLLGQKAPLRAGTLQAAAPEELQKDASSLLGIVPENGNYAVMLDPGWLPLVAGLKLGVETKVGDADYDTVAIELAERCHDAVASYFETLDVPLQATTFTIKEPGQPVPDTCFGEENGKIPFFMEWDGQLMHGFVIVALERITDFVDEAKLAAVPEPNFAATSIPSSDELPAADAGSIAAMADLETPAVDATSLPDLAEFSQESKVVAPLAEHDAALSRPTTPSNQGTTHPKPQHSAPMTSDRESATPVRVQTASFPDLGSESIAPSSSGDLGMLADVELDVTVELGRRRMPLSDILRLTSGSVVELEKLVGEPLQIFANNRLIAEGEAVVIDDQFGVRITSLASRTTEKKYA